jgi:outer membrane protein assembly factor BamB
MDRRRFLRTTAKASTAMLIGCAAPRTRTPGGAAAAPTGPREPAEPPPAAEVRGTEVPAIEATEPPAPAPDGAPAELAGDFPEWNLGGDSASPNTMLMFRGNPSHTFYGTGPVSESPKLLWRSQLGKFEGKSAGKPHLWEGTGWTGHPVRWGGRVFVGAVDSYFYCFEATTGRVIWKYQGGRMFKGSSCFYRGKLYTGNVDNSVRCIDARVGKELWRYDSKRDCDSSPCVVDDRLYIGGEDGLLKCFDPATGSLHWKLDLGEGKKAPPGSGGIESSPAVVDGEVYVGHYDGYLLCADARTGAEKWRAPTGGDTDVSPVVVGDLVYIAAETEAPYLRCFDRSRKGKLVWQLDNRKGWWSTPAVVGDRLYVGGNDGVFYCLDARSGKVVWTFKAGGAIWASPSVVDGKIVFGSYDPYLYMLDAERGQLVWKHDMGQRTHSTACIVQGKIYVGGANGFFHCFG